MRREKNQKNLQALSVFKAINIHDINGIYMELSMFKLKYFKDFDHEISSSNSIKKALKISITDVEYNGVDKKEEKKSRLAEIQEEYFHKAQNWYKKYLSGLLLDTKKQKRFYYGLTGMFILSFALVFAGLIKVELLNLFLNFDFET